MTKLPDRIRIITACLCFAALSLGARGYCADFNAAGKGAYGLSLNYPGAGVKYFFSDRYAMEIRGQAAEGVTAGGLRFYDNFRAADRMNIFWGLEADYISFKGEVSRGSGAAGELFCGFEYFVTRSASFQADFGPAYIYLKDRDSSISSGGVEFVANFSFAFYWGTAPASNHDGIWMRY